MKPLALLSIRAEPVAAADEHAAFARYLRLEQKDLHRVELGSMSCGLELDDYAGVLLGGGAFTYSDAPEAKSERQLRAEDDVFALLDEIVERDFPFLGACYGIGTLGTHQGGVVDRTHAEAVGPVAVSLTELGSRDPLFAGLPTSFAAYGGHKEGLTVPPAHAAVLATSSSCPVQAFRIGEHVYATQFHPELDLAGLATRIEAYAGFGYFEPSEAAGLLAAGTAVDVRHPGRILANFAARYRR
ncbi:MAG: glutamine amidotransferase [Nocardioides sp.]